MVITRTIFICQNCGYQAPKWLGRCPDCQKWNALIEEKLQDAVSDKPQRRIVSFQPPQRLNDIKSTERMRTQTNIKELDRVLGGGIVAGSVILIGGEPGIGKSTLLLQVCSILAKGKRVLYVSGEESMAQTKLRADRLGILASNLYIVNDTGLSSITEHIEKLNPEIVVIDSIQVLYNSDFSQSAGSVTQIRECAGELVSLAKYKGFSLFIVGHVTKEGLLAGPKILEHMVDCVIYFEGQSQTAFRILRSIKNRYGPTNEIGVFHMTQNGLVEVENPSAAFLSPGKKSVSGSATVPAIEGTRPIFVEIQALVTLSNFTISRQRSTGVDFNRLLLLLAVLEKRLNLKLANHDVFVNVAGGIKVDEPACDLAICLAIVSSFKNKPVSNDAIFIGEVGLGGEIRSVGQAQLRIDEAVRLGFKKCILPSSDIKQLRGAASIELLGVENIKEAVEKTLE